MVCDYINPKLLECVLVNMEHDNGLAIWVSMETGLRISDVLKIRLSDISENGNVFYIAKKTGKRGKAHISKDLHKEIILTVNGRPEPSEFLFPGRRGDKPRTRQAVYRDVKKAVAKMGSEYKGKQISPHTARKVFAVETLRDKGISAAQKALQHSSVMTTLIYLVQGFEERLKGIEKKLGL